jgi:catalase
LNSAEALSLNPMVAIPAAQMDEFYKNGFSKERIFHGNGSGFGGSFTCTNDISEYTTSDFFTQVGKQFKVMLRLSSTSSQHGTCETYRDTRGYSIRLESEQDGIFDIVGLNVPIQYVIDRKQIKKFHSSQQVNYASGMLENEERWNWFGQNPGSTHNVLMTWGDRGIPKTWRNMNGYGVNTFSFINSEKERYWVKFHFKTMQGNEYMSDEEAQRLSLNYPHYYTKDFYESIRNNNFPKWKMYAQVIPTNNDDLFDFNIFRMNNVWPHSEFPLIELGVVEINNCDYHQWLEIEKMAWSPSNVTQGIGLSPDGGLLDRITTYPLVQKSRLNGVDINPISKHVAKELTTFVDGKLWYRYEKEKTNNSIYRFAKSFYDMIGSEAQDRLSKNLHVALSVVSPRIVDPLLQNFKQVDQRLYEDLIDLRKNNNL